MLFLFTERVSTLHIFFYKSSYLENATNALKTVPYDLILILFCTVKKIKIKALVSDLLQSCAFQDLG